METDLIERMRQGMRDRGVAAMVVTPGADLRFLADYDAKALERLTALVIPANGGAVLIAPQLEEGEARESGFGHAGGRVVTWTETDDPFSIVATIVQEAGPGALAVDDHMWAQRVLRLREVLPERVQVLAGPIISEIRQRKTSAEIEQLQHAASAIESVHARVPDLIKVGMTEAEAGRLIAEAIIEAGHVTVDFVIVASGPNGANPHHAVSDRVIESGDPIVVDIGGTMPSGYRSDCTRTYVMGEASEDFLQAYAILQSAQESAVGFVRPGRTCEAIDAHARDLMTTYLLEGVPLSQYFIHRIGHGIGLESHEEPYLVAGNTNPVESGMTFSIEPGFYVPERFGARIEDIVVCTPDGVRNLNLSSHDLVRIPA